jgi:hypothetical protein
MNALLSYWRVGLVGAVIVAAGVWHLADKSKGIDDAVELVRAEYINEALAVSEAARSREQQLITANQKVANDFQTQKTRNAAAVVVSTGKLRDLEAAIANAGSSSSYTASPSGADAPFAAIASECGRAFVALDEYATEMASTARALQQYANGLRLK